MKRVAMFLVGAMALSAALDAEAAAAKKKGKKKKAHKAASHGGGHHAAAAAPGGPFSDVPQGHWAYEAIKKAVDAGILQGWENKFHGGKVVNRYQMAVVVARMIDRLGVMRAGNRTITAQDVANLEALTIEFADELALLNVKVNKLEDAVNQIKKDIDWVKAEWASGGAKGGISGAMSVRGVFTGDGGPSWAPTPFTGAGAVVPNPAATGGLTRYRGGPVSGAGTAANPFLYDNRNFATVSNFSMNIDRWFDPKIHFHSQIDINAEGSRDATTQVPFALGVPFAGRGENFFAAGSDIIVNEAYVTWEDWFASGINGRAGVFALPMNTEVNGPSRTYTWTITPSVANSKWESIRPVGVDVFKLNAKDELAFYVGFFTPGDTANGLSRAGTLISQTTAIGLGAAAQTDPLVNPAGAAFGLGRFPTPLQGAAMTDAARGVAGQTLASDDIGFYGYVGTHPTNRNHRGFTWHLAYFDRNGDIRAAVDEAVSATDWYAWQGAMSYQWHKWIVGGQYYSASSENYNTGDIAIDPRRANTTPFINVLGTETDSMSAMAFVNWQFNPKGALTARYEMVEDETSPAKLEADIFTFALNWRTSDKSWLQAEYITSDSRSTSENGFSNDNDISDDLFQVNYKMNW